MRAATPLAALIASFAAGCSLAAPPDPVDPNTAPPATDPLAGATARQLFDANVAPALSSACASCHAGTPPPSTTPGPNFLGTGALQYYSKLVANPLFVNAVPDESELLTKGLHEGPALTTLQATNIEAWLTQEVVERGAGLVAPPPPTDLTQKQLVAFGACMSAADFTSTGLDDLPNQDTTGDAGPCYSCHATGMYIHQGKDATVNLQYLRTMPWLLKFAQAQLAGDGSFKDIVPANRFRDRGQETGHPPYTLSTARQTALASFFQLTYARWKAGSCPAP